MKKEKLEFLTELNRIYEKIKVTKQCITLKDLAITCNALIAAGIPKGKKIGKILKELLDDVIDNPEHNTREYLLSIAERL